jgi:hypothetical protein
LLKIPAMETLKKVLKFSHRAGKFYLKKEIEQL